MNRKFLRLTAFLIAVMTVAATAAACANNAGNDGNSSETTVSDGTTAELVTEDPYDPKLPESNFDGSNFTILTKAVSSYGEWGETSIWTEAQNGDVVNDAIYLRNSSIEETYNVKIVEYQSANPSGDTSKSVAAADNAYDVVMPAFGDCGTLSAGGNFLNLSDLNYVNFSKGWWDQRSIADLTIANKLFFVSSDISTLNNDATWCTMFNKDLIGKYTLKSPYDLVKSNEWTYDNFYNLYKGVSSDLDGNGKFDPYDLYANLTQNENYNAMFIGGGERLIGKDENDYPIISLGSSERAVGVLDALINIMQDEVFSLNYHTKASGLGYHLWTTQMFEESRGLFWITNLQIVIRLRNLDLEFGIVPVPKYSADQASYANVVWTVGSYVAVPKTAVDLDRTGIILEAMAAKSMQLLRPAYYDVALTSKYLRDEESVEMLDIVIAERVYDLGLAYNFGGIADIVQSLVTKKSNAITGAMDSKTKAIQNAINKTVTKFEENT